MNFNHCTSFEQLAREGPVEMSELRKYAGNDLKYAKCIAAWRLQCATADEAARKATGR